MRRRLVALVVVLAAAVLLAAATGPALAHSNDAEADAQLSTNGTLLLEWEFAKLDGYLVVRRDDGGDPGEPIGVRRVSEETAFRTDTTIDIDEEAWAGFDGPRPLWVTLHREDGGAGFDLEDDPLVTFFGNVGGTRLTVAPADRTGRVTAQEFGAQTAAGETVTVRRVEMPADGYLAVHGSSADVPVNAEDDDIGAVGGVTALEAGVHENVTVDLASSFVAAGDAERVVQAVLYRGEGAFDADGTEPITAGDAVVNTAFGVEFAAAGTPEPTAAESDLVTTPEPTATEQGDERAAGTAATDGDGSGLGALVATVATLAVLVAVRRRW